jgi:hypothetical protein
MAMETEKRQLWRGLIFGVVFGFLLQKSGATQYDVILGQLLLKDFTVLKIMLSAVVVGSVGIYLMRDLGWVQLMPKAGSWGKSALGGLIFGVGFAVLGYCPGTIAGAVGNGYLDAAVGGLIGIILGSGLLAAIYPRVSTKIMTFGDFGDKTLPQLLKVNPWAVLVPLNVLILLAFYLLERAGL